MAAVSLIAVSHRSKFSQKRPRISAPILVDSGFRRGSDIVKALACGANAVLLGKTALKAWPESITSFVILKDEADRTLAQIGCPEIGQLSLHFFNLTRLRSLSNSMEGRR
jgi:(S)-mandelate dehydrogenase